MRKIVLLLIVSLSTACSWVPLSGEGEGVQILANNEVIACERVGNTKATVLRKLWIVPRRDAAVEPRRPLAVPARSANRNSIARRDPRRGRVQQTSTRNRRPPARVTLEVERGLRLRVIRARRDFV